MSLGQLATGTVDPAGDSFSAAGASVVVDDPALAPGEGAERLITGLGDALAPDLGERAEGSPGQGLASLTRSVFLLLRLEEEEEEEAVDLGEIGLEEA